MTARDAFTELRVLLVEKYDFDPELIDAVGAGLDRAERIEHAARAWADVQNEPRGRSGALAAQLLHDALRTTP